MQLVLPFASAASPGAQRALQSLRLPHLERLLALMSPGPRDEGDDYTLSPPHERALATASGWPLADGLLPLAARAAARDGLRPTPGGPGWGLLSPTHWHVGTDQISLADPQSLALDTATSRALFSAVAPLFQDDGWALHWGAPTRWYATHAALTTLPTASLDRVIGRNVDLWLNSHPGVSDIRRLQAEVQMTLHTHPVNEAREERGLLPVNSFWLSGTGPVQTGQEPGDWTLDERLRSPALAEDWAAWAEAWAELDAGPIHQLLLNVEATHRGRLILCGERHAQTWVPSQIPWWRRPLFGTGKPRLTSALGNL
jgi:hypothetical protein